MSHEKFQSCIDACSECAVECNHCATECLHEKEVAKLTRCIQLDRDCAAICSLAVDFMSRNSEYAYQVCELCAEICTACAEECEKNSHLNHCKKCAGVCRRCAEECRAMSKMSV